MRIAFVGKGGSGKTTLAALAALTLAKREVPVLALDVDINQNLAVALGIENPSPLSTQLPQLKEHLRGTNPRINRSEQMIKTTPPGRGSRLLSLPTKDPFLAGLATKHGTLALLRAGEIESADVGVRCYHSKTGAVELLLNHLVDTADEWIVADMTAGADAFASGLFTRFDATFVVVEPTIRSVAVYRQYAERAQEYGVYLRAVGNKIRDAADEAFLVEQLQEDLVTSVSLSTAVRNADRAGKIALTELEQENERVIDQIIKTASSQVRNWERYHEETIRFHQMNAESWANAEFGTDLARQIDPDFFYPI